jgi:hypothetical protein
LGIVVLTVFIFNSGRISRALRCGNATPKERRYQNERTCAGAASHEKDHFRLKVKKATVSPARHLLYDVPEC